MELKELTRKVTEAVEDGMAWRERLIQVPTPCGRVEVEVNYPRQEYECVMACSDRVPGNEHPNLERFVMIRLPMIPYTPDDGEEDEDGGSMGDFCPFTSRRASAWEES